MKIQSKNNLKHWLSICPLSIPVLFIQSPVTWDSGEMLPSPAGRVQAELSQPPMGRGENCSSERKHEVGSIRQLCLWTAAVFSRHMPQASMPGGADVAKDKPMEAFQCYPGASGSTQHGTKDQPKYRMRRKKRGRQRMRGNHRFIINVSYNLTSFRMSSVNNLYEASPIDCE